MTPIWININAEENIRWKTRNSECKVYWLKPYKYTSGNQTNTEYFYQFYNIIVVPVVVPKTVNWWSLVVPNITTVLLVLIWYGCINDSQQTIFTTTQTQRFVHFFLQLQILFCEINTGYSLIWGKRSKYKTSVTGRWYAKQWHKGTTHGVCSKLNVPPTTQKQGNKRGNVSSENETGDEAVAIIYEVELTPSPKRQVLAQINVINYRVSLVGDLLFTGTIRLVAELSKIQTN